MTGGRSNANYTLPRLAVLPSRLHLVGIRSSEGKKGTVLVDSGAIWFFVDSLARLSDEHSRLVLYQQDVSRLTDDSSGWHSRRGMNRRLLLHACPPSRSPLISCLGMLSATCETGRLDVHRLSAWERELMPDLGLNNLQLWCIHYGE